MTNNLGEFTPQINMEYNGNTTIDGKATADEATSDTHLPTWGQVKQNASDSIAGKLNISDTASMLAPYYLASNPDGFITDSTGS